MDTLERRTVALDLTQATEADEDKDLEPSHRHGTVGRDLPPILLEEQEDGTYLVRDGHHRRLIAIANGETHIEAYICPLGWESTSGSSFPYFWRHGEASVEWNGVTYDYGCMWGGCWRFGGKRHSSNCEGGEQESCQGSGDCDDCRDQGYGTEFGYSEPSEGKMHDNLDCECKVQSTSADKLYARLRECNNVECCGPFGSVAPTIIENQACIVRRMELAGQLRLG